MSDRAVETYRMMYRLFPVMLRKTWMFAIAALVSDVFVQTHREYSILEAIAAGLLNMALVIASVRALGGHTRKLVALSAAAIGFVSTLLAWNFGVFPVSPSSPSIVFVFSLRLVFLWLKIKLWTLPFAFAFRGGDFIECLSLTWRTISGDRWWALFGFTIAIAIPTGIVGLTLQHVTRAARPPALAHAGAAMTYVAAAIYLCPGLAYYARDVFSRINVEAERVPIVRA